MKTKILGYLVIVMTVFTIYSCKTTPDCETRKQGNLVITNQSSVASEIHLDGNLLFNLQPKETKDHVLSSGEHTVRSFNANLDEVTVVVKIVNCEDYNLDIVY